MFPLKAFSIFQTTQTRKEKKKKKENRWKISLNFGSIAAPRRFHFLGCPLVSITSVAECYSSDWHRQKKEVSSCYHLIRLIHFEILFSSPPSSNPMTSFPKCKFSGWVHSLYLILDCPKPKKASSACLLPQVLCIFKLLEWLHQRS